MSRDWDDAAVQADVDARYQAGVAKLRMQTDLQRAIGELEALLAAMKEHAESDGIDPYKAVDLMGRPALAPVLVALANAYSAMAVLSHERR